MKHYLAHLTLAVLLAACGSKSKSTPETTPETTPEPGPGTGAEAGSAAEPTPPAGGGESKLDPGPDPAEAKRTELAAAETAAYEKAKPVFEKFCSKCHSKDGKSANAKKLKHFDMTTYPFGGEHAADISKEIREVLAIDGGKATMPADKKGAVKGADLELVKAWADAFDAAKAGGAHTGA